MEFTERLKKILAAYREGAHQDLLNELIPILSEFIHKQVQKELKNVVNLEMRDLEDLLTVVRELKDNYSNLDQKTGSQMIRIDDLKQIEYKLTELILAKRI